MFLPNPGVLAAGAGGGKTYDEFVAHLQSLTGFNRVWGNTPFIAGAQPARSYRVIADGSPLGGMIGSPWGPLSSQGVGRLGTQVARMIQHALPSEASFTDQIANGRTLLFSVSVEQPSVALPSVTRNGFSSSASTGAVPVFVTEVLAWIDGQPMRMQPFLGLGPEPYDW